MIQAQISTRGASFPAGAVRKHPTHEGIYEILCAGPQDGLMMQCFCAAEEITAIATLKKADTGSGIVTPGNGKGGKLWTV